MSDSNSAGVIRRFLSRFGAGALLVFFGATSASTAAAQEPADAAGDFEARAQRLRDRVATLEASDEATAADALRELGVDPEGLGYWCKWSNWPNWCNWNNWSNWGNWPNWCNW